MTAYSIFHGMVGREITGVSIDGKSYSIDELRAALSTHPARDAKIEALEEAAARQMHDDYGCGSADLLAQSDFDACIRSALVERLTKALEVIAKGDTTVFDEDLQCDVEVSMDADEMSSVARAALTTKEGAAQ